MPPETVLNCASACTPSSLIIARLSDNRSESACIKLNFLCTIVDPQAGGHTSCHVSNLTARTTSQARWLNQRTWRTRTHLLQSCTNPREGCGHVSQRLQHFGILQLVGVPDVLSAEGKIQVIEGVASDAHLWWHSAGKISAPMLRHLILEHPCLRREAWQSHYRISELRGKTSQLVFKSVHHNLHAIQACLQACFYSSHPLVDRQNLRLEETQTVKLVLHLLTRIGGDFKNRPQCKHSLLLLHGRTTSLTAPSKFLVKADMANVPSSTLNAGKVITQSKHVVLQGRSYLALLVHASLQRFPPRLQRLPPCLRWRFSRQVHDLL
mmetsp:Transcript_25851/g.67764  ORF Transcript_25851/g.67764 Transcript_25851/m.67764 type:complete len:323 (+) Transcript_25851:492-1460(+)